MHNRHVTQRQVIAVALLSYVAIDGAPVRAQSPLTGQAAKLFKQAETDGRSFAEAARMNPEVRPTSDGNSFYLIWRTVPNPKRWIVSLHGAGRPAKGYATDDLVVWRRHLKGREVGLVCLQWWLGKGDDANAFYAPPDIYREIDLALSDLKVAPGSAMLHGFSRGSANSYAVIALDAGQGKHYFSLAVASSGGVSLNYPPNRALLAGQYGDRPLTGTRWITVAGGRDPNPDRDGIAGMRRTAAWLKEQGAVVVQAIEDPASGHGAFHLNPANSKIALDAFLK